MLDKVKSAGFDFYSPDSLLDLGELITEVSPEDFKLIPPENLRRNLRALTRKVDNFSPCQRMAIMSQVKSTNLYYMKAYENLIFNKVTTTLFVRRFLTVCFQIRVVLKLEFWITFC